MISAVLLATQPDAKLAEMVGDGSDAAFEAIVRRYRRALVSYCRRLLLSDARGEDVVQQAFIKAWSSLRAGTEVTDLQAWLHRITHNEAISALRRPEYDFDELNDSIRGASAPESDLERRMLMREALAAVAALPTLQREAILRTAVDGHSYEDVAATLGLSDGSVRGLVYRARASLRAGMAALAPNPLVVWAAGQERRAGLSPWLAEIVGGGSAGGAAVVIKSATILAASAVVAGGTVGAALSRHTTNDPARPANHGRVLGRIDAPGRARISSHGDGRPAAFGTVQLPRVDPQIEGFSGFGERGEPNRSAAPAATAYPGHPVRTGRGGAWLHRMAHATRAPSRSTGVPNASTGEAQAATTQPDSGPEDTTQPGLAAAATTSNSAGGGSPGQDGTPGNLTRMAEQTAPGQSAYEPASAGSETLGS